MVSHGSKTPHVATVGDVVATNVISVQRILGAGRLPNLPNLPNLFPCDPKPACAHVRMRVHVCSYQ